jgi:hypothetical protein
MARPSSKTLWAPFTPQRQKMNKLTSNLKNADGKLIDYGLLVDHPFRDVVTIISPNATLEEAQEGMKGLLGQCEIIVPPGEGGLAIIKTSCLSEQGAKYLEKGYWRPGLGLQPNAGDPTNTPVALAIHKKTVIGTEAAPVVTYADTTCLSLRFHEDLDRNTVYKKLEVIAEDFFENRVPEDLFLDGKGKQCEKDDPEAKPAQEMARMWMTGVKGSFIHRIKTPAGYTRGPPANGDVQWTHQGNKEIQGIALIERPAWRIDCPIGLANVAKEAIQATAAAMKTTIESAWFPYPRNAINDLVNAYLHKQPWKKDSQAADRQLLRLISIPRSDDPGLVHPTSVANWLAIECGINMIGAVMHSQLVSRDESEATPGFVFLALVDKPTPTNSQRLMSNKSRAVRVTVWTPPLSKMTIDPREVHLVEGTCSVRERGVQAEKKKVTTDALMSEKMEQLRKDAVEQGIEESNAKSTMVQALKENAKLESEIEAITQKHRTMQQKKKLAALTKEMAEMEKQEMNEQQEEAAKAEQAEGMGSQGGAGSIDTGHQAPNTATIRLRLVHHDDSVTVTEPIDLQQVDTVKPGRISVLDLVKHAIDWVVLPTDLGLEPSLLAQQQQPLVYLDAAFTKTTKNWGGEKTELVQEVPTIGKERKAALVMVTEMDGADLQVKHPTPQQHTVLTAGTADQSENPNTAHGSAPRLARSIHRPDLTTTTSPRIIQDRHATNQKRNGPNSGQPSEEAKGPGGSSGQTANRDPKQLRNTRRGARHADGRKTGRKQYRTRPGAGRGNCAGLDNKTAGHFSRNCAIGQKLSYLIVETNETRKPYDNPDHIKTKYKIYYTLTHSYKKAATTEARSNQTAKSTMIQKTAGHFSQKPKWLE